MTENHVYYKAFAALADCPSFAQVEQALKTYAHELAEQIRAEAADWDGWPEKQYNMGFAADLIDPKVAKP